MVFLPVVLSILQGSVAIPSRQSEGATGSSNAVPHLRFATEVVHGVMYGSAKPLPFVDSVVIRADRVIVTGYRGVPNVGDELTARLTVHDSSLIIDINEQPGTAIGAIVVLFRYSAVIEGVEARRYLLSVRDRDRREQVWRQYTSTLDVENGVQSNVRLQTGP